jgi:hypothetical protein
VHGDCERGAWASPDVRRGGQIVCAGPGVVQVPRRPRVHPGRRGWGRVRGYVPSCKVAVFEFRIPFIHLQKLMHLYSLSTVATSSLVYYLYCACSGVVFGSTALGQCCGPKQVRLLGGLLRHADSDKQHVQRHLRGVRAYPLQHRQGQLHIQDG